MPARLRRHVSASPLIAAAVTVAGFLTGLLLLVAPKLPGLAGAAVFSVAAGEIAGHVFGHGLTPWVALGVGGVFALLLDRRI
jgi:hypothetical protein